MTDRTPPGIPGAAKKPHSRLSYVVMFAALGLLILVLLASYISGLNKPQQTTNVGAPVYATPTPARVASPTFAEFDSTCTDASGDGGAADLTSVELHSDGKLLFVTYRVPPNVQAVQFSRITFTISAFSKFDQSGYQIGSTFTNGLESANYVFDLSAAKQANFDNGVVFADGQISARYPVSALPRIAGDFSWYGVVSVDMVDTDFCGGPMADSIIVNPAT
ncbi:hypothetical protein BH09ACT9_BH09ACT9_00890 [soil metagenome]